MIPEKIIVSEFSPITKGIYECPKETPSIECLSDNKNRVLLEGAGIQYVNGDLSDVISAYEEDINGAIFEYSKAWEVVYP